jgi:hypothetical protein
VSLGIRLVRSRPASPQDNGGHERMHRDLSELQLRPARTRSAQQRQCDRWVVDFNEVRPHDALGGKTPAEVYRDSPCRFTGALIPSYPGDWQTRRVNRIEDSLLVLGSDPDPLIADDDVRHRFVRFSDHLDGMKRRQLRSVSHGRHPSGPPARITRRGAAST